MEDLVGLIAIIVFALINMVAQSAKKKQQRESKPAVPDQKAPKTKPSSLEQFFEKLAEKLEPQEQEAPAWPEGYEKPDYMQEMKEFEAAQPPPPPPHPVPEPIAIVEDMLVPEFEAPTVSMKAAIKSIPSALSKSIISIPSISMSRSQTGSGKGYTVSLRKKSELKKAMIANIIFSAPRAYDTSFENTIVK